MSKFKDTMRTLGNNVQMSEHERVLMRERIGEYMKHTPIRTTPQKSPVSRQHIEFFSYRFTAAFMVVALLFGAGAGVTYASNDALPGEALYPVKELKEEITEAIITDQEKRAAYVIDRVHTRLQEAEALAAQGKLDDVTEKVVTEKFATLTAHAEEQIDVVAETAPAVADALRIALDIGTEVRAETLAMHDGADRNESNTDARARIARVARANIRIETRPTLAIAAAPRVTAESAQTAVAVMDDTNTRTESTGVSGGVAANAGAEGEGMAMMMLSAVAPEQTDGDYAEDTEVEEESVVEIHNTVEVLPPAPVVEVSPARVEALMREFEKQYKLLTQEKQTDNVISVREEMDALREEITRLVARGEYTIAEQFVRDALRTMHIVRARSTVDVVIDPPRLPAQTGPAVKPEPEVTEPFEPELEPGDAEIYKEVEVQELPLR